MPVLLVHGSGLDSSSWAALISALRESGWPPEYLLAVNLAPDDGANIVAAESQLLPAALQLLDRARARATQEGWPVPLKLAVIGHSMGAVSGRWLAVKLIPERIAVFVAIAGANHGTGAVCGLAGQGNREMCPPFPEAGHSLVLDELNGTRERPLDETPFGSAPDPDSVASVRPQRDTCIAWYTVLIDPDEWIMPTSSARLGGAGGADIRRLPAGVEQVAAGEFRLLRGVRHDDVPAAIEVTELVASLLSEKIVCPAV